jgi:hypothetical protein
MLPTPPTRATRTATPDQRSAPGVAATTPGADPTNLLPNVRPMQSLLTRTPPDYAALDFFALSEAMIEEMMTDPAYRAWADREAYAEIVARDLEANAAAERYDEMHAACSNSEDGESSWQ